MKGALNYPNGVCVVWSPCNQAYLVLWHRQVLRVISRRSEAVEYADHIVFGGGA